MLGKPACAPTAAAAATGWVQTDHQIRPVIMWNVLSNGRQDQPLIYVKGPPTQQAVWISQDLVTASGRDGGLSIKLCQSVAQLSMNRSHRCSAVVAAHRITWLRKGASKSFNRVSRRKSRFCRWRRSLLVTAGMHHGDSQPLQANQVPYDADFPSAEFFFFYYQQTVSPACLGTRQGWDKSENKHPKDTQF